jgi:hypothetical protein
VTAFDPDSGDSAQNRTYAYQWYVNGNAIEGATDSSLGDQLFKKGDSVFVKVKAFDGTDYSAESTSKAIVIGNAPPVLSNASVTPDKDGDENTEYRFTVTYTDMDNDAAASVMVKIDGSDYSMTKVSGSPLTGVIYEYVTKLSAGTHKVSFSASDGTSQVTSQKDLEISTASAPFDWFWVIVLVLLVVLVIIIIIIDHSMRKQKPKAAPVAPAPVSTPVTPPKAAEEEELPRRPETVKPIEKPVAAAPVAVAAAVAKKPAEPEKAKVAPQPAKVPEKAAVPPKEPEKAKIAPAQPVKEPEKPKPAPVEPEKAKPAAAPKEPEKANMKGKKEKPKDEEEPF